MQGTAMERSMLRTDLPEIRPGDTVRVYQKVKEGEKERVAQFEGVVLARKHGNGITATVTVRKVIEGIGVERVFPLHLPTITKIDVLRHSKVRRAKLYYIRDKAGREVRKRMKQVWREAAPAKEAIAQKAEEAPEVAAE
ncbi:MAG TPA: 50S ribosomal protein L19 [Candidatus Paceibacterota bacterium]|nr:50S ribosomal protein L19 [Candidatus Paceibacterota bacterium]